MVNERGFSSVEEMNDKLIENWNSLVYSKDIVYHLGDFALAPAKDIVEIMEKLNGRIRLIKGNHDSRRELKKVEKLTNKLEWWKDVETIKYKDKIFFCSHYPHLSWPSSHYGSIMLHGHQHGHNNYPKENMLIMDVGVDCWRLKPISINFICEVMEDLLSKYQL